MFFRVGLCEGKISGACQEANVEKALIDSIDMQIVRRGTRFIRATGVGWNTK